MGGGESAMATQSGIFHYLITAVLLGELIVRRFLKKIYYIYIINICVFKGANQP